MTFFEGYITQDINSANMFQARRQGHDIRTGLKWYGWIVLGWEMVRQLLIVFLKLLIIKLN
jgi:hypothetical protein